MKNIFKTSIVTICLSSFNLYGSEKVLTAFENSESQLTQWQIVDDGVMGGLSKGKFKISDSESLIFKGNLSLKNNGGFSSIRSKRTSLDLSNYKGIKIRTRGDGRNYKIRLESNSKYRRMAVSFQYEFTTVKGEWSEVFIPFEKLKASFRGWNLPNIQFNSKTIKRVGIIIADKKEGPFELEVDWIKAS